MFPTPNSLLFIVLVASKLWQPTVVRGDYVLRVHISDYSNPGNTCPECAMMMGCCDAFGRTDCSPADRCDNWFLYCLMALGNAPSTDTALSSVSEGDLSSRAEQLGCLQPPTARRSQVNTDGEAIDFTAGMVLGLPNPLEFEMTAAKWQGITLYVDVIDDDSEDNSANDELVDAFLVDLAASDLEPGAGTTLPQNYLGIFGIATINLSFQLECLPGFDGNECLLNRTLICDTAPCSNGGLCDLDIMDPSGFTCTCVGDFTGQTCDVVIDDCLSVSCNNGGSCVDGVQSFTCECEVGYTGQFCEQQVVSTSSPDHDAVTTITDVDNRGTDPGPSPEPSGDPGTFDIDISRNGDDIFTMVGVVSGAVLFVLAVAVTVMALSLLVVKQRRKRASKGTGETLDNPVYDGTGASSARQSVEDQEEMEREWDNPIYGLSYCEESYS